MQNLKCTVQVYVFMRACGPVRVSVNVSVHAAACMLDTPTRGCTLGVRACVLATRMWSQQPLLCARTHAVEMHAHVSKSIEVDSHAMVIACICAQTHAVEIHMHMRTQGGGRCCGCTSKGVGDAVHVLCMLARLLSPFALCLLVLASDSKRTSTRKHAHRP
jgi:hypothetical protein